MFGLGQKFAPGATGPQACIPGSAQAGHTAGMNVAMGDGSCRNLPLSAIGLLGAANGPVKGSTVQTIFNAMLTMSHRERIPDL